MKPRSIQPHLFFQANCELGEGPFWFEERLWWVDINAGKLHSINSEGKEQKSYLLGRRVGAAAPIEGERFIVAVEDGIGIFDGALGKVEILASPEEDFPGNRFNDGKCDPMGRFVAGTLNMQGKAQVCALYSFEFPAGFKKLIAPVSLSNGLAWNADGSVLYFVDSSTREIAAFDYDCGTGQAGARAVITKVPPELGIPDGMTIDVEGNLWVAHWDGGAVRCWSAKTGECLAEIVMPCLRPTSCCFGGPNFQKLFITTAQDEQSKENVSQRWDGNLFVCEPGVGGLPVKTFKMISK